MSESSGMKGEGDWQPLASIDKECFGCGPENSHGLKMCFEFNGSKNSLKVGNRKEVSWLEQSYPWWNSFDDA